MSRLRTCEDNKKCQIYLNTSEYTLIMSQHMWICLNNTEYDWICQHIPDRTDCWICRNSELITEQLSTHTYSDHCQTFKIERFAKRIMPECRCAARNFQVRKGRFVELGHIDKEFVKNTRKILRSRMEIFLSFFS